MIKKAKKIISVILLTVLIFYYIYPTALPLMGYTFLFTSGALGLLLYIWHKFPYSETVSIGMVFLIMACWSLFCEFVNNSIELFLIDYTKSQIGWLFSAYLVIFLFFKVHPNSKAIYVAYYLIAVVALQCIISVVMSQNDAAKDFFNGLQGINPLEVYKRQLTEGDRLLGYGSAFFGAGICCGTAMVLLTYVLMSRKWKFFQLALIAFLYCGIFYVGLLSARTTMVGGFASIALMIVLIFYGKSPVSQLFKYIGISIILFSVGYTMCYLYYPEFSDWAFEAFISYQNTGEFQTNSSSGLAIMFVWPSTASDWLFGRGMGQYIGSDVGFTRLWTWFGLTGAILYFYYEIVIIKQAFTNNTPLNLTLICLFVYNLVLNYKGLSDLNSFCLLFAFYFLYYKYYIYTPYLYRLGKFNQTKLRYAVQAQTASRRF